MDDHSRIPHGNGTYNIKRIVMTTEQKKPEDHTEVTSVKVPLQATHKMLSAGTDVRPDNLSAAQAWEYLSRAWPVMVSQFAQDNIGRRGIRDDVHELIAFLTSVAEADPIAMGALINHRVSCNNAMLMHPTLQCGVTIDGGKIGMLGILNGYAGKFRDGKYQGWGPIAAVMEKNGNVASFQYTEVPWNPPKIDVTSIQDDKPTFVDGKIESIDQETTK